MPALIAHDTFAKDIYGNQASTIGEDNNSYQAFLLGNQGPDPLFYSFLMPLHLRYRNIPLTMHKKKPTELLASFVQAIDILDEPDRKVGQAYAMGFMCHYLLDSAAHPLVLHYQYVFCNAGVEGLDQRDKSEIHHLIESEYDEVILYKRLGKTIASFNPSEKILRANDYVLDVVSKMYVYTVLKTYGTVVPSSLFAQSVRNYRLAQGAFYSKTGLKREILSNTEELFRRHSFLRATMLRDIKIEQSDFDNHERNIWQNPFTEETSNASLWDIYDSQVPKAATVIENLSKEPLPESEIRKITKELNFSGEPTQPIIL